MMPKHEFTEEGRQTEEMLRLISDIFRLIAKPVDKDSLQDLAPGEIGIDFGERCIYVKNPYTGEVITPNSLAHLQTILNKFDVENDILTADAIGGVRIYTSIEQLRQLQGLVFSVDTIIRQMEYPSILISHLVNESPSITQLPSASGILTIIKLSEDHVTIRYTDSETCSTYNGMFDAEQHLFTGWMVEKGVGSVTDGKFEYGDDNTIQGSVPQEIGDLSMVVIRLENDLTPETKINLNNTGLCPVQTIRNEPLSETIPANSIIMLIRDEVHDCWLYAESSQTALSVITEIASERLILVQNKVDKLEEEIEELKDQENVRKISKTVYNYTVPISGASRVNVPGFNREMDCLFVNLGQTILRQGLDYAINSDNSITFDVPLLAGSVIQFLTLKGSV